MEDREVKFSYALIVNIVLTIVGLAGTVGAFGEAGNTITKIITAAMYLLISYYVFYGYRIPHGNLFRWVVLLYALTLIFPLSLMIMVETVAGTIALALSMVFISFFAGRLGKFKQNIVYMVIISVTVVVACLMFVFGSGATYWTSILLCCAPLIMWANILIAYISRYKDHIEAGIEEAKESKK